MGMWIPDNSLSYTVLIMWKSLNMWLLREWKYQLWMLGSKKQNPGMAESHWWGLCLWNSAGGWASGRAFHGLHSNSIARWGKQVSVVASASSLACPPQYLSKTFCLSFYSPQAGVTAVLLAKGAVRWPALPFPWRNSSGTRETLISLKQSGFVMIQTKKPWVF